MRNPNAGQRLLSQRVRDIPSSTIRGAMKLAADATACGDVVNLAQGLSGFPTPQAFKDEAIAAIAANRNQYCDTFGHPLLRQAIAKKYQRSGLPVDWETEVTVTCGVSEGINLALLTVVNPGDEVIMFEPFYENHRPNILIAGGVPKFVQLRKPDWTFDRSELARAFNKRTKAIIINNPNNPTSRVFTLDELQFIASLCQKWGTLAICDEIYEHMVWDGRRHVMFSTLPGMEERTFTCSGLSKTYNVTGWRVGWVIAPAVYTEALRRVHDYLTLSAPTPFQYAGICALESPPQFYDDLVSEHTALRDRLAGHLQAAGFNFLLPQGSYFFFADCSPFGFEDDRQLAQYFAEVLKVIAVPGSAFYQPGQNTNLVRFCFAKPLEMLDLAGERLLALASRVKN